MCSISLSSVSQITVPDLHPLADSPQCCSQTHSWRRSVEAVPPHWITHLHNCRRPHRDSRGAASENQYCPQRGFLWDWNMCSAVLLPSHAPLPWHAMRIFTLNFVCHCLKYALWIRCYVFSLLISLSSFNWSLEASSTRVAGIILLFPWRVQLLLPFKGISQGLKLFLSVFPGIQSHAFHRLSHHPSLFCFYDQVRRDCTRFASSSLYSGFILDSTYPQAFFAPQSPFFPSIMLNMCSFYKLSLCFSIPTLNFLNWQLQHCKPSTKKIPSFRKDEQSLVSQRSRLRS